MTPTSIWRDIDLAAEARAGRTAHDIAEIAGTTSVAVRSAAFKRGIALPKKGRIGDRSPREHIKDMTPNEAIEYLLGVIETQMPYLQPKRPHVLDDIAPQLTGSEKLLAAALVDASPSMLTHEALYSIIYNQRPQCDMPDPKIICVFITKARSKIPPSFGVIESIFARGYRFIKAESDAVQNRD